MKLRYVMALMGFAYSAYVAGGTGTSYLASASPSTQVLERIREEFLDLKRPIKHSLRERRLPGTAAIWPQIVLKGKARSFAQHHSLNDRIYALDDYLNDPEHSLAAFLVLSGSEGMRLLRLSAVEGGKRPSSLTEVTGDDIEYLRWRIARMLNKPLWWRGPSYDPLHDYTSMVHDRANRAEHIEALRAMLRDRALIKKHKLEMGRIFAACVGMEATNAATEIADYLIVDRDTGDDITQEMLSSTNHLTLKAPVCPATLTLAQLGAGSVTPVLDKLLRVADTYGVSSYKVDAAIVFTLSLLNYLGMKNEECFHVVERYRASCSGLSGDQRAALDQLADALEQRDDTQLDALSVRDRIDTKRAYYLERARKSVTERLKVIVRTEDDVTDAVMAFDGNSITLTVTAAWARLGQNGKDTIASRIWNTTASYSQGMGWTDKYSTTTNLPQLIFVDTDGKQLGSCSY